MENQLHIAPNTVEFTPSLAPTLTVGTYANRNLGTSVGTQCSVLQGEMTSLFCCSLGDELHEPVCLPPFILLFILLV